MRRLSPKNSLFFQGAVDAYTVSQTVPLETIPARNVWRYNLESMPIFSVVKDSAGYEVNRVPMGLSAGFADNGERFLNDADLKAELLKLGHTEPQINSMFAALDQRGEAYSKVVS
jgi:hypothetical protein